MKKYYKYLGVCLLSLGIISCDNETVYPTIEADVAETVALNANGLDFTNYVSVGASFTAGYTDGAMFIAAQENSFPNILSKKFAMAGGGSFEQPLMNDNIGGLITSGIVVQQPRLFFNSATSAPTRLPATPTTILGFPASNAGNLNNFGVPGAKSFHLLAPNYGDPAGLATSPATANPYFVRMASSPGTTVLADIAAKQATFFTLSEIGGNDVLGYATTGGDGTDPITPIASFEAYFDIIIGTLTAGGAKGVVANLPDITSLAHFTTVPYNSLDPKNAALAPQIATLNAQLYGPLKNIFTALGQPDRINLLSATEKNPILIFDENATDFSAQIAGALTPALGAQTAGAFGAIFGKARQAKSTDLFVLPSSGVIATVFAGAPAPVNVHGVSYPLADKWVLTPQEQNDIKIATDGYNAKIKAVVAANDNLALADLNQTLITASTTGIQFDRYTMSTQLVRGGLISLDGIHLTSRGYALMANEMLKAIDAKWGSNFATATDGLAKADDYPTNYDPSLQ